MGKGDTSIKVGCRMRPFIAREKGEDVAFTLTQNQVLIRFGSALKPHKNQMFGLNVYDSDGNPSHAYTIPFRTNAVGADSDLRCYYITSEQGNSTNNFVDLSGVIYDTLPTTSS